MKKSEYILGVSLVVSSILFTGCFDNPLGVGYEHSTCEASSAFGVCGNPKDIYQNRDKIRQIQQDYLKSGIDQNLYFAIDNQGSILIKDERDGKWEPYNDSKYKTQIDTILKEHDEKEKSKKGEKESTEKQPQVNYAISDIPVTEQNDLSIVYKTQGSLIETRTNVGNMIRDYGLIQKVWIAPVVDSKGDLFSAHDILVVIKDPKWIIGESTPTNVNSNKISQLPTPISKGLLELQNHSTENENNIVNHFNSGDQGGLIEEIAKDPIKNDSEFQKNMNQIQNYIKE
jgi:hypothetical protein